MLGIGGVIVAYTQYEISELKAMHAKEELSKLQSSVTDAKKLQTDAEAATSAAVVRRDLAIREQKEAEVAVAELKTTLTLTNNELTRAKPNEIRPRLTYVHFRGDLTRDLINDLRQTLSSKEFNAPGAERVAGEYLNSVRYFKSTEKKDAEILADAVESFFASRQFPLRVPIVLSSSETRQNPPLEVWLSHKCSK